MASESDTQSAVSPAEHFSFRVSGGDAGTWNVVLPVPAEGVLDLPALLRDTPQFLNFHLPSGPRIVALAPLSSGRAAQAGFWTAVDENGNVIIVGIAGDGSRQDWTELVRETMALLGRLWRMSVEEYTKHFASVGGLPLWEIAAAVLPAAKSGDKFRSGLEQSLARGHFAVRLVAADENDECRQAIGHLAMLGLDVVGLVPEHYECCGVEVVVARPVIVQPEPRAVPIERPKPAAKPIPQPTEAGVKPATSGVPAGGWQSQRPPTLATEPRQASFGTGSAPGVSDDAKEGKIERNWPKLGGLDEPPVTKPAGGSGPQSATRSPLSTRPASPPAEQGKGPGPGTMPGTMSNKRPPKSGWGGLGSKR